MAEVLFLFLFFFLPKLFIYSMQGYIDQSEIAWKKNW